jgi:hypothetical protein
MKSLNYVMWCAFCAWIAFAFTGCGKGDQGEPGPAGLSAPAAAPLSAIQTIVAQQNAYRATVGQAPYTNGLTCNLYTVPTTTTAIIGAVLTNVGAFGYVGAFNQPNESVSLGFNVLPVALQPVYQTWFITKCTGVLVVADSNWHEFSLSSDDGSNLYINGGAALINNDGLHGLNTVNATKLLEYGVYTIEVDYFQSNGNQGLILSEDGNVMDGSAFYH